MLPAEPAPTEAPPRSFPFAFLPVLVILVVAAAVAPARIKLLGLFPVAVGAAVGGLIVHFLHRPGGERRVLVAAALIARRLSRVTDRVEEQLKPILAHLDHISKEASRASTLAVGQVERVDALFADIVGRLEQLLDSVQTAMTTPMREGSAILAGIRAAVNAVRDGARTRSRGRGDDEDALFV